MWSSEFIDRNTSLEFCFLENHIKNMEFASPPPVIITLLPLFCPSGLPFHFHPRWPVYCTLRQEERQKPMSPTPAVTGRTRKSNDHLPDRLWRSGNTHCHHATEEAGYHLRFPESHTGIDVLEPWLLSVGQDSNTRAEAKALSNIHE